jgi:hypothetical protein
MKDYTLTELRDKLHSYGYEWLNFQLIAIRSAEDKFDEFDDKLYLVWGTNLYSYSCTTNPGSYYLITKFLNPDGTAVLKPGQYKDSWQRGLHRGSEALIQAKPVTVWRDNNRDQKSGGWGLSYDTGMFGIDVHNCYGLNYKVQKIFNWSAGCIVLNDPNEYREFTDKCKRSNLKYFTLALLEEF